MEDSQYQRSKRIIPAYPNQTLTDDLAQLADLIGRGKLVQARETVKELERRWPDDLEARRFARVLAPPAISVREGGTARPRHQEYHWFREHAREYRGCWLAILGGRLIAASPDVEIVVEAVRQDPKAESALLHF